MDISKKTLIILPHLDDEFALVPLIKMLTKYSPKNLKIIYCAERTHDSKIKRIKRRSENAKALKILGCQQDNITYLNDFFEIQDLKLFYSSKKIFNFIKELHLKEKFNYIVTLNFEGGHPDHDALALIIDRFSNEFKLNPIYIPAYNNRKTMLIPISVFRPLKSQIENFTIKTFSLFCWKDCLKVAYTYKTEKKAFIKLLPFILLQVIFSKKIYISNSLSVRSFDYNKSLSKKRYGASRKEIIESIKW